MRPRDNALAQRLRLGLLAYEKAEESLPGIGDARSRTVFLEQMLESEHRVAYIPKILGRDISIRRADPNDELFDPIKAAILSCRKGELDEAFWLTFLFVHFGRHSQGGWRYIREVYGSLGGPNRWTWERVSSTPMQFREWLNVNQAHLKRRGAGFGNHRKYESLDAFSDVGTGAVVESYVRWVTPPRTHVDLVDGATAGAGNDARSAFRALFKSMQSISRFGRTARFDYLAMLGKLGLANIIPDVPYLKGATGPLAGAKLLFGDEAGAAVQERRLVTLGRYLDVGMQVMEDSLCNWQKSPREFIRFRG